MIPIMSIAVILVISLVVAIGLTCWIFGSLSLAFTGIEEINEFFSVQKELLEKD